MELPNLNFGCHFDNRSYLIPSVVQDNIDNSVDANGHPVDSSIEAIIQGLDEYLTMHEDDDT